MNGSEAGLVLIYSVIFLGISIGIFYFFRRRSISGQEDGFFGKNIVFILLSAGFLLRIFTGNMVEGYHSDLSLFRSWALAAAHDFTHFYDSGVVSDYPPLYIYVLSGIGKLSILNQESLDMTLLLKLPSMLADLGTAYLFLKLASRYISEKAGILIAAFYIFNPAVLANSTLWGQVDSFFTLLVVSAVVLLAEKRLKSAAAYFAASVLMKPQGIIFLPILFFELVRRKSFSDTVQAMASFLLTGAFIILPFSGLRGGLGLIDVFRNTIGEYPYASVNGFNFFYLLGGNFRDDTLSFIGLSYHTWGMAFIVIITFGAWLLFIFGKEKVAPASALVLITGVFTFSVSMHERYLFPAVALSILCFIYLRDRKMLYLMMGFSLTSFINTYVILWQAESRAHSHSLFLERIGDLTAAGNIILFLFLVISLYKMKKGRGINISAESGIELDDIKKH